MSEKIDLTNPPKLTKVVGYTKRKTFNQVFTKAYRNVSNTTVLNTIFNNMYNVVQEQQLIPPYEKPTKSEELITIIDEKIFKTK